MGFKGAQFTEIFCSPQSQGFPPLHRWMLLLQLKTTLWRFRSMKLNDGWRSVALKCPLQSIIGGICNNPDTLHVGMQGFQFGKDGSSEKFLDKTGGLLHADDADGFYSHRSDETGL